MADDDKNEYGADEEYQFADLEMISPEESAEETSKTPPITPPPSLDESKNIRRNALLAVGAVILAVLFYKLIWPIFSVKNPTQEINPPAVVVPLPTQPVPQPQIQPTPVPVPAANPQIDQKLSALEMSQQNVRNEVDTVNSQLSGISSNVSDLTSKITELTQTISSLTAKVNQQADEISQLTVKARPKPRPRIIQKSMPIRVPYYIQAVIPGRAWLVAPNGSTLTVREGSQITGYGIVRLIDPNQGRVIMSSGEVIRFSQQDS